MTNKRIAIFVVAYNAANSLEEVLRRIPKNVMELIEEVYVYDDASQDSTYFVGQGFKAVYGVDKLNIYRNPVNLGYGGNQKQGFDYAISKGYDVVALLHGDAQYAPEALPRLLDPILNGTADAVLGSRMLQRKTARREGLPLFKYLGIRILSALQNLLLGTHFSEFHCGYRVYSTHALRQLNYHANSDDYHFDTQIILQLLDHGFNTREAPVPSYRGGGINYFNGLKYALNVLASVLRYKLIDAGFLRDESKQYAPHLTYQFKEDPLSSHMKILKRAGTNKKILDLGCGSGFLSANLRQRGNWVVGIDCESSAEAPKNCDVFLKRNLEQEALDLAHQEFDLVIMADVLEHLRDTEQLLENARSCLSAKGRLIVSTGNVANIFIRLSLLFGQFSYGQRGILDATHVRLYTLKTFRKLLTRSGFQVKEVDVTPIPLSIVSPRLYRSSVGRILYRAYYLLCRIWKTLFAYQFILVAEPRGEAKQQTSRILTQENAPVVSSHPAVTHVRYDQQK